MYFLPRILLKVVGRRIFKSEEGVTSSLAARECPACGADTPRDGHASQDQCSMCGTIWFPSRRLFKYDDSYPAAHAHHDPTIARCKQVTLRSWLRHLGIRLIGQRVLEVGFGGGATLEWMQDQGALVYGQEPVAANRAEAIRLGIPHDRVGAALGDFPGQMFDLVLYQDSFEHLLEPRSHLAMLDDMAGPGSHALLVLPVADCLSRRLLRGWWPHDIDDHWVFYSTGGVIELWRQFGWMPVSRFFPWKYVSAVTISRHWQWKTGLRLPLGPLAQLGFWLNFGERGLVFEKDPIGQRPGRSRSNG